MNKLTPEIVKKKARTLALEGRTTAEIAKELDLKAGTVGVWLAKWRKDPAFKEEQEALQKKELEQWRAVREDAATLLGRQIKDALDGKKKISTKEVAGAFKIMNDAVNVAEGKPTSIVGGMISFEDLPEDKK